VISKRFIFTLYIEENRLERFSIDYKIISGIRVQELNAKSSNDIEDGFPMLFYLLRNRCLKIYIQIHEEKFVQLIDNKNRIIEISWEYRETDTLIIFRYGMHHELFESSNLEKIFPFLRFVETFSF